MKNNKFWIIIIVLFIVLSVMYTILVSSERDKLSREQESKKRAIKELESIKERAKQGHLASDETRKAIDSGVLAISQRIKDIDAYLKDTQKDFIFVKGDKDWKFLPESSLQYKGWYNKKREELITNLQLSGFVFEKESPGEISSEDMERIKEKMGFRNWGNESPSEKEILEAQQQLALFSVIIESLGNVFKDKKSMFPVLQKVTFDSWMLTSSVSSNILNSKATLKLDCPYALINLVINELEKGKIQLLVENLEVLKKANAKDYAEFPNVSVSLNLNFQIINEKKVNQ